LVTRREQGTLKDIERYAKTRIEEAKIPTARDIESKKKVKFLEKIKTTIHDGALTKYSKWVDELVIEGFTEMDIAAALIKMEVHHQISEMEKQEIQSESFYEAPSSSRGSGKFEKRGPSGAGGGNKRGGRSGQKNSRLFITLGKKDRISPRDIVGAIAGETGLAGNMIGNIDIYDKFSFVEIPEEFAEDVIKKMKKSQIRGNKFKIEIAEARK
jgi:ATP-dependent RNA helicase DeaD